MSKTPTANLTHWFVVLAIFVAGLHLTFTLPGCGNSVQESEVQPETTSQEPLKEPHSSETSGADEPSPIIPEEAPIEVSQPEPGPEPKSEPGSENIPTTGDGGSIENDGPELPQPERTGPTVDWASLQWPPVLTTTPGQSTASIYGQVYAKGITDTGTSHPSPKIQVELGYGPIDKDPAKYPGTWAWTDQVTFHKRAGLNGNNYEFKGKLKVAKPGWYRYTYRYAINNGPWTLGDRNDYNRKGSSDGSTLEQMGTMVVVKPGSQIRVASYNLHCQVEQPQRRMQEIAKALAKLKPDVVALQEVCQSQASGSVHSAAQLSKLLKQEGAGDYAALFVSTHTANHDGKAFQEGLGLLSRLPILEHASTELPPQGQRPSGAFPRKALWARLASPVGIVSLASTHLSFRREHEAWRITQVEALKTWLADTERQAHITLVAGDYNASPDSSPILTMQASGKPANTPAYLDALKSMDGGNTFPARNPSIRIDYLFLHQPPNTTPTIKVQSGQRILKQPVGGLYLSDHIGILAVLLAQ